MNTIKSLAKKATKFSAGKKVTVFRGGAFVGNGRYVGKTSAKNGDWHQVNFAAPRKPAEVRSFRAANLTLA